MEGIRAQSIGPQVAPEHHSADNQPGESEEHIQGREHQIDHQKGRSAIGQEEAHQGKQHEGKVSEAADLEPDGQVERDLGVGYEVMGAGEVLVSKVEVPNNEGDHGEEDQVGVVGSWSHDVMETIQIYNRQKVQREEIHLIYTLLYKIQQDVRVCEYIDQPMIRTPFYFKSPESASQVLTPNVIASLSSNPETLVEHPLVSFVLETQPLERPYYHITTERLKHKTTGQEIQVFRQVHPISSKSQFQKAEDFIYKPPMSDNQLLNRISGNLKEGNKQLDQEFVECMFPLHFLKSFNLKPPLCDMFQVKMKDIEPRKSGISVSFDDDEVPTEYYQQVPDHIGNSHLFQVIKGFYQKRPIFLKNVLLNQLKVNGITCTIHKLKNALSYIAYYYRNGPWKNSYVRLGYNPKLERQSLIYQVVIIKIKNKQIQDFQKNEKPQDNMYDPTFASQQNSKHLSSYQLCDLDDNVKEIVRKNLDVEERTCNRSLGWLSKQEFKKIFRILKSKIN